MTNVEKESISSKLISFRNFKDVKKDALSLDLQNISIETEKIDNFAEQFEDEVKKVIDIHAPLQEKQIFIRAPKPWFTENILILKRKFRRSEGLWK